MPILICLIVFQVVVAAARATAYLSQKLGAALRARGRIVPQPLHKPCCQGRPLRVRENLY
jgi:hypothetical protein